MKHAVIIQARLNSKRFPQKVLQKIGGVSLVQIIHNRLIHYFEHGEIIFAIPASKSEDRLADEISKFTSNIYRGSEHDVLKRYYDCAIQNSLDLVTRITADCPLVCGELIQQNISYLTRENLEYCSNTLKPTYPDGLDCETFTFSMLEKAHNSTSSAYDREHVTPFIKRTARTYNKTHVEDLSHCRLTVDYAEDLSPIARIIEEYGFQVTLADICDDQIKQTSTSAYKRDEGANMSIDQKTWQRAKSVIPDGNQFLSKRPRNPECLHTPIYYKSAQQIDMTTLDGRIISDYYLMGVGTNSLGYSDQDVNNRVIETINSSSTSSLNSLLEIELAERLINISPGMEMVKFAKTGAEANSIALRIARSFNNKNGVALCGYHGWHDWYLSANLNDGSSLNDHLFPGVQLAGVPKEFSKKIHAFKYNDITRLKEIINQGDISCVIMEVERNVPPADQFLEKVRQLCNQTDVVLIFDECSSGFRQTFGGLYTKHDVQPDMVMYGKALTNGFPLTAVAGHRDLMLSANKTFISSTYFSEATSYAAALATLDKMESLKSWKLTHKNGLMYKTLWQSILNKTTLEYEILGIDAMPKFNIKNINFKKFINKLSTKMLTANIYAYETIYPCIYHDSDERAYSSYSEILEEEIMYLNENQNKFVDNNANEIGFKRLN